MYQILKPEVTSLCSGVQRTQMRTNPVTTECNQTDA